MKCRYSFLHSLLLVVALCSAALAKDSPESKYPEARKSKQVDDFHGTKVADPYRWLEDPDSPESRRWIEAQNKITFKFLDAIPRAIGDQSTAQGALGLRALRRAIQRTDDAIFLPKIAVCKTKA